jgi:DNA gyrase subunit A
MNVDHYKTQNRGGVGMSGIKVHEDDYVEHILMTSTHDYHLFFTNKGRVYKIKGYKIPEGSRQSKGLPIVNLLEFQKDEKLASFTNVKDFEAGDAFLTFVTKKVSSNVRQLTSMQTSEPMVLTRLICAKMMNF